jgi:hypothetical protein
VTKSQRIVVIGAVSGVVFTALSTMAIYQLWPMNPILNELDRRLAFTLCANVFAALPLLIGIIVVGNNRFLSEAIDPLLKKENTKTQINGHVVENTLEQFVLFFVGTMALSASVDVNQMRLIPAATFVFLIARIAFWIGYRIHPLYRAFGMAATGYLNVGIFTYAIWRIVS